MKAADSALAKAFRKDSRECFEKYLPQIVLCLRQLSEEDIWWRPNEAANAAGNIVLHLSGNVRQWIISGLGGAPDLRVRDLEFSERGPVSRRKLIAQLKKTVEEACEVIDEVSDEALLRQFRIQGYRASGLAAIAHVYEHFAYHAGQIVYLTKLKRGKDLKFTRLPAAGAGARQRP